MDKEEKKIVDNELDTMRFSAEPVHKPYLSLIEWILENARYENFHGLPPHLAERVAYDQAIQRMKEEGERELQEWRKTHQGKPTLDIDIGGGWTVSIYARNMWRTKRRPVVVFGTRPRDLQVIYYDKDGKEHRSEIATFENLSAFYSGLKQQGDLTGKIEVTADFPPTLILGSFVFRELPSKGPKFEPKPIFYHAPYWKLYGVAKKKVS